MDQRLEQSTVLRQKLHNIKDRITNELIGEGERNEGSGDGDCVVSHGGPLGDIPLVHRASECESISEHSGNFLLSF